MDYYKVLGYTSCLVKLFVPTIKIGGSLLISRRTHVAQESQIQTWQATKPVALLSAKPSFLWRHSYGSFVYTLHRNYKVIAVAFNNWWPTIKLSGILPISCLYNNKYLRILLNYSTISNVAQASQVRTWQAAKLIALFFAKPSFMWRHTYASFVYTLYWSYKEVAVALNANKLCITVQ